MWRTLRETTQMEGEWIGRGDGVGLGLGLNVVQSAARQRPWSPAQRCRADAFHMVFSSAQILPCVHTQKTRLLYHSGQSPTVTQRQTLVSSKFTKQRTNVMHSGACGNVQNLWTFKDLSESTKAFSHFSLI